MVVKVPAGGVMLEGELQIPENAPGVAVFVHGSGSSRFSERNGYVAERLRSDGLGTFLFDLLTEAEDRVYSNRFDIPLITQRLLHVTRWLRSSVECGDLPISYFGASTGSAAALKACATTELRRPGTKISAVVSRGGRPDLVGADLSKVVAPTLLIVGSADTQVLALNRSAFDLLKCEKRLELVPGATHLFQEPGALDEVARLTGEWLASHFPT